MHLLLSDGKWHIGYFICVSYALITDLLGGQALQHAMGGAVHLEREVKKDQGPKSCELEHLSKHFSCSSE